MNTKAVCKEINVSIKALRIYEDLGIVVPKRDENNYRNYSEDDMLKLRQVILLKEIGIPLKSVKKILNKEIYEEYKLIHILDFQLKAVENKINELNNIKNTLKQSINETLNTNEAIRYSDYFSSMDQCLSENREKRVKWLDKWDFDSWAKNYDSSVKGNLDDDLNLFEKYDFILQSAANIIIKNNAKNVIDIGCGTGNLYGKLNNDSVVKFIGVDQSVEMLIEAKKKYPHMNLRLGNFLDEPFIENEFDVVISTFAFHHLNSLEKKRAIDIMFRYLKPKGRIIIADLMFLNAEERIKQKEYLIKKGRKNLWDIIEDEYYTNIEQLDKYVKKINCKLEYKHIVNFTWILQMSKII
ncbi:MAG: MerR family transcriptional regulator [Clostridium sp.]|nr:MerR family transcriptional regulator [Clostridium sp.]